MIDFNDLEKIIILHIFKYGAESPIFWKRISKEYSMNQVREGFRSLQRKGIIEYCGSQISRKYLTSSIKNTIKRKAKPMKGKRSYFCLTRDGKILAKNLLSDVKYNIP
ncbi:MAG: hypothetical protein ACP5F1_01355 [Thermoplasmata archaeon]|nr:hypothetical protein [Thermoplasmata archaeon]